MKIVKAIYRQEDDGAWIGSSPSYPGFIGHGDSYEEARERVQEGLPFFAEEEFLIAHVCTAAEGNDSGAPKMRFSMTERPRRAFGYRGWFQDQRGKNVPA